jgi:hypothetical protein
MGSFEPVGNFREEFSEHDQKLSVSDTQETSEVSSEPQSGAKPDYASMPLPKTYLYMNILSKLTSKVLPGHQPWYYYFIHMPSYPE